MFQEDFQAVCNAGNNKVHLLEQNPQGYFISSMLAGSYVAFGSFAAFVMGTPLKEAGSPMTKAVMGFCFVIALSLVIFAGSELFTGNVFVMAAASITKKVPWGKTLKLMLVCYIGNLAGALLAVAIFQLTGVTDGAVGGYFAVAAETKMSLPVVQLLARAILCNILVCLAVWCCTRIKSESAKLIMIFWCIFTFMICGYEHSVANMSTMAVGVLNSGISYISIMGYFYNLFFATVGNIIGGVIFVAVPYYLISKQKQK